MQIANGEHKALTAAGAGHRHHRHTRVDERATQGHPEECDSWANHLLLELVGSGLSPSTLAFTEPRTPDLATLMRGGGDREKYLGWLLRPTPQPFRHAAISSMRSRASA